MGEYYDWVNIDKKEYISPGDFGLGNKLHESSSVDNCFLGALYDLLYADWKGDAIVFLGDQTDITEKDTNPVLKRLSAERQAWGEPGYDADYVTEIYRCISGLYKASEKAVRREIEYMVQNDNFHYNPFGVKRDEPYKGLFVRNSRFFRYTINHSKKEFFDIESTHIENTGINPLPFLMAFPGSEEDKGTGLWLGDKLEVTDNKPPSKYRDMSAEYGWNH